MAADFSKPTVDDPSYINVLASIREQFQVVSTMSYGNAVPGSLPTGAVQFLDGRMQKWDGSAFVNSPIGISGGGTGASTAAGARVALNVPEAGVAGSQVRTNAQSDALYVPTSREITTSGALTGGGAMTGDVDISIADASTSTKGAVQLYNGLNSTSTSLALTAAMGKSLSDSMPYYNESILGSSNQLTGGSCLIVRVGSMITISGYFTHSPDTTPESAVGYIPSWARPYSPITGPTSAGNVYFTSPDKRLVIQPDGTMSFVYSSTSTATSGFTITYSGGQ